MNVRLVYEVLSDLARRIEAMGNGDASAEVKRLSREQYKANTLNEQQLEQTRKALEQSQQALDELKRQYEEQERRARLDVVTDLFPVLDSIESGVTSGAVQIKTLLSSSPEAAKTLAAWLNGQRLLRERLLALLASQGVRPLQAKNQAFDPDYHVAVKVVSNPSIPSGQVVAEERRGYISGETVLRYAEVVVNKTTEE
ncbi:MAG: nucleotide exchange factor GrpE [Anaerolineae bacterium]|nr:nucleotide exchange factor GrpE [Anaerolineae bacterium]